LAILFFTNKPTFMSFNLIDSVKGLFTSELIGKAASMLGENESGISKAVSGTVPAVLSSLLSKSGSSDGATGIFNMAKEAAGSGILGNITGLLGGGNEFPSGLKEMAGGLLGNKLGGLGKLISGFAGVKESSAASLLGMAVPSVLGFLGKHATDNNLSASGLASMLGSQKDNIMNAMPAGLNLSSLGLGSSVKSFVSDASHTARSTVSNAQEKASGGMKALLPLLFLGLAALAIWYFWRSCNATGTSSTVDTVVSNIEQKVEDGMDKVKDAAAAVTGKLDSVTGDFIYDIGEMMDINLPGGTKLNVGKNSTEAKLFAFLSDASAIVDTVKGNWFDFTNVRFKSGSSTITPESMTQLKNMVAICKAFPNAQFKIGGYTDNTGDSIKNVVLSQKRAEMVAAEIVKMGAAKASVTGAEGYGPQWPVGDNNTPEGRAMNRRVSVRVKAK
jgi:OmpA-OmpF porin, OOP family